MIKEIIDSILKIDIQSSLRVQFPNILRFWLLK